jgi:hypothetical protein
MAGSPDIGARASYSDTGTAQVRVRGVGSVSAIRASIIAGIVSALSSLGWVRACADDWVTRVTPAVDFDDYFANWSIEWIGWA